MAKGPFSCVAKLIRDLKLSVFLPHFHMVLAMKITVSNGQKFDHLVYIVTNI